jgi:ABC-type sugar transport system ATPase subunit
MQGGSPAVLGIRPHDIRLTEIGSADATARIEAVQPLGSETLLHLRLAGKSGGTSVQAMVSARLEAKVDGRVGIRFARQHIHLFDTRDGRRLNGG